MKYHKSYFEENGYLVFNVGNDNLIDAVNKDVDNILKNKKFKTNTKIYSYNDSPRIVESYRFSENCKKLALNKEIITNIQDLFNEKPRAFSTINFLKSTQQPLHSDYSHFGTIPELKLVGSWIALEDIDSNSGPLQIVPKSHKMKIFNFFEDIDYLEPTSLNNIKKNYSNYEKWVVKKITENNLRPLTLKFKKGDCILWDANLLHGSPECKDNNLSRKSQVTHWSFDSVLKHYNPIFSNPTKSQYKYRGINFIN